MLLDTAPLQCKGGIRERQSFTACHMNIEHRLGEYSEAEKPKRRQRCDSCHAGLSQQFYLR